MLEGEVYCTGAQEQDGEVSLEQWGHACSNEHSGNALQPCTGFVRTH